MRFYRRSGIVAVMFLAGLLSVQNESYAQGTMVGAYNAKMNNAVGGVVTDRLGRRGFAANDPRVNATTTGMSTGLGILAMGIGGSVTWPVLLVAAGFGGLVAGGVALYEGGGFKWLFGNDGTVTASGTVPGSDRNIPPGAGQPIVKGSATYMDTEAIYDPTKGTWSYYNIYSNDPKQLWRMKFPQVNVLYCSGVYYDVMCYSNTPGFGTGYRPQVINATFDAPSGYRDDRPPPAPTTIPPTNYPNVTAAANAVPSSVLKEKASNAAVAAAVNAAWKAAPSANETGGIPWSASDPITPEDVANWSSSNPGAHPTVSDFFGPAQKDGSSSISIGGSSSVGGGGGGSPNPSQPGTTPGTVTPPVTVPETPPVATTPGEGQDINWGPNPNVGAPKLEAVPTTSKILDPLFNVMPDLKTFTVPAHNASCPTAGFNLYGHEYKMDAHCGLLEQNRSLISACMVLAFSLASIFIVLRA